MTVSAEQTTIVVFDVNETLSDLRPIAERFTEVGAPAQLAQTWFASLLRDGFAATVAGHSERFADIGRELLRLLLPATELTRDVDEAADFVMTGFLQLPVHEDVPAGIDALYAAGLRLVTLTNGGTQIAEQLLTRAGLDARFERLLSAEDAGAWKPARSAYEYAATACEAPLDQMVLVACHPWDIDGASRAGMRTAWINRAGTTYPSHFAHPDITATGIANLAEQLSP
ncbi:HAD family hydrolase [Flindersiella endophytica]